MIRKRERRRRYTKICILRMRKSQGKQENSQTHSVLQRTFVLYRIPEFGKNFNLPVRITSNQKA